MKAGWWDALLTLQDLAEAICINDNHMMYGSWDMEHNKPNFFVILDRFLPFYPPMAQKIKILKKWKKPWRYYHFTHVYHKLQSYDVWFLRYWAQHRIFCHFGPFFCPFTRQTWQTKFLVILNCFLPFYPPNNPKNQILKNWKNLLEITSFYISIPKIMIICYILFLRYGT